MKYFLSLCLIISSFISVAQKVALFSRQSQQGNQLLIDDDWSCNSNSGYCYEFESILIPEGWEVWLFRTKDFSGPPLRLDHHGSGNIEYGWSNQVNSIRIVQKTRQGSNGETIRVGKGIAVFKNRNFEGDHVFISDDWNCDDDRFCYDVESIYVPEGWEVWGYRDKDFKGTSRLFSSSWDGSSDGYNWRNCIQSMRISRKSSPRIREGVESGNGFQVPVVIYEHEFSGRKLGLFEDWTTGGFFGEGFNDQISSIQVAEGYRVVVYEHSNYGGKSKEISGNWKVSGASDFWNDRISSIRILRK